MRNDSVIVTKLRAFASLTFLCLTAAVLTNAQTAAPSAPAKQTPPATAKKKVAPSKPATAPPLELEPKAIEILKATSSKLAAAHTLSFTAVETFESLSRQGVPLVYGNKFETVMQRPNKLRVLLEGDGPSSEFYYDGKVVLAYVPSDDLIAAADAPPTIDDTLHAVFDSAGIYFPFTDMIVTDPYGDMAPGLKHAYYVGQSHIVDNTTTDIVAFAGSGIFAEMWVGAEDKLPRIIHAIYLDDPDHLRHNLIFSNWKLDTNVSDDFFTASHPTAKKIPFAHPHPQPGPGAKPPVTTRARFQISFNSKILSCSGSAAAINV